MAAGAGLDVMCGQMPSHLLQDFGLGLAAGALPGVGKALGAAFRAVTPLLEDGAIGNAFGRVGGFLGRVGGRLSRAASNVLGRSGGYELLANEGGEMIEMGTFSVGERQKEAGMLLVTAKDKLSRARQNITMRGTA